MVINEVYSIVNFVSNKEQRGQITPAQFNVLARAAQLEYISKRVGNPHILNERGVATFGYESQWRLHEDLRPLIYGPVTIPIDNNGNFNYPYGYIWPDAVHKNDFRNIRRITADQYPYIKHSTIVPPTEDYPIMIMRGQYGYIDPYSIGSFQMSYLKMPPDPVWAYTEPVAGGGPLWNPTLSVDFSLPGLSYTEIAMLILQHVGINLSTADITTYASQKEMGGI
jgi:hypothetical protein